MNHLFNMEAQPQLIIQGISSIDELIARFREIIKEETTEAYEISKAEACRRLGISYPTLMKRMDRENISELKNTDLDKLK